MVGVELLREGEGPELVVGGGSLDDLRADRGKVESADFEQVFDEKNDHTKLHSTITMNFLCSKQCCCVINKILIITLLYNIFDESLTYI